MTSRIVQWREPKAKIRTIPLDGITDNPGGDCEPRHAYVFAGRGRTGGGGSWRVDLGAIACEAPGPDAQAKVSIVATPTSDAMTADIPRPVILMARTAGTRVTIWSLDVGGAIVPNVEFSWHAVVEGTLTALKS